MSHDKKISFRLPHWLLADLIKVEVKRVYFSRGNLLREAVQLLTTKHLAPEPLPIEIAPAKKAKASRSRGKPRKKPLKKIV